VKERWLEWSEKYLELTQREKVIIAFAAVFLSGYLFFVGAIDPQIKELKKEKNKLKQAETELAASRKQIDDIRLALQQDPNERVKQEIQQLQSRLLKVNQELDQVLTEYVAPEQMATELTELLSTAQNVRITGVQILEPVRVKVDLATNEADLTEYYKHYFQVVVNGEYFPLMDLVERVIEKNRRFAVDDLSYVVQTHPDAQMTLTLVTVSNSKNAIRL